METIETPVTKLLGIQYPIILAGMNVAAGPSLAAAVSNSGGLGVIGGVHYTPSMLRSLLDDLKAELHKDFDQTSVDFTLEKVFAIGLATVADFIGELSGNANKELAIETALEAIEGRWVDIIIDAAEYKEVYFKIKSTDDLYQVLEDDAVATAAPPWSRARLEEFDATVLRAAGWLSVRLGWRFGGERAQGTTWSRDDGRGCACACDVSQRPWCALGRDCLVWSSVAYLASAGRTFDAWAALEDAPPNLIDVGHIDRVAAAFSKVVVVPALAKQSGDAPGAWLAPHNTTCAPELPTTAGSTASNATASDAALARLAALRAAGSLTAAEFARAAAKIHGNDRRPRRRLAYTRS